jgi:hypothetical protein
MEMKIQNATTDESKIISHKRGGAPEHIDA